MLACVQAAVHRAQLIGSFKTICEVQREALDSKNAKPWTTRPAQRAAHVNAMVVSREMEE